MPVITKRLLDGIAANGRLQILRDDDLTGFGVQVTAAGSISFCVTYLINGKSKRRVIGRYKPMTVEQARKLALSHLGQASDGTDPLPDIETPAGDTAQLFESWMAQHVGVHCKPSTTRNYRECFNSSCRKPFGAQAPHEITFAALSKAHAGMADRPSAANHMLRTMRALLSWAEAQKRVVFPHGNPASGHRLFRDVPRERMLSVPEIRAFITDLPKAPMDDPSKRALLVELLLAQRSGEIAAMRKGDVDLASATWTIRDNKSSRPHLVPLPPWSRALIEKCMAEAKGNWLFPSPIGDPKASDAKPIESHALSKALHRAQRPLDDDGQPLPKKKSDTWVFDFRNRAGDPAPITPHDLRRTCSSYLELLGHGDVVRGALLNHSRGRNITAKHYSAAELLKLKRTALLQWEAALRKIMAGEDPFASLAEDDRAEEARLLGTTAADPPPAVIP